MQLSGKNIIVTGAATGIGRAIAEIFAQNGAALVLADVNDTDLCATASKIVADGSACSSRHADVSCASEVQALVRYAEDKLGGVDVVVN
ncbi:MAG: SDR family NAD(P)-dependent oxidoreductase, partial [Acidimicrobiia bacterium]